MLRAAVILAVAALALASDPPVTENLLTWLDPTAPDAFVLAEDGVHVRQWTDQSGRNKHFVQTDPAKMPLLVSLDDRRRRDDPCSYCGTGYGNGTGMVGSGGTIGSSPYRRRSTGVPNAHIFVVSRSSSSPDDFNAESVFKVVSSNGRSMIDVGQVEFGGGAASAFAVSINALGNAATAVSVTNVVNPYDVWAVAIEPQMGWSTRVTIFKNNAFLSSSMLLGTPPYGLTSAILGGSFTGTIAEVMVYSQLNADERVATTQFLCEKHLVSCS
eukprot:Opistho-1_new@98021